LVVVCAWARRVLFEGGCEKEEMTDLRLKMSWREMDGKLNELHVDG